MLGVIGEQIVLFRIDDRFDHLSGVVSFFRNAFNNNIHDFWDQSWETLEDLFNDVACDKLELLISILNEFKCWISQLLQLRVDQINKHVY